MSFFMSLKKRWFIETDGRGATFEEFPQQLTAELFCPETAIQVSEEKSGYKKLLFAELERNRNVKDEKHKNIDVVLLRLDFVLH